MWAAGVVELGLTPEFFWSLTPAEYDRLFSKYVERERREDRRAALIAMYIANYAGKMIPAGHSLTLGDFGFRDGAPNPVDEMEHFRRQINGRVDEFIQRSKGGDPNAEVTLSRAVLDAVAQGRGRWGKLGTREGLMQPVSIIKAMNPDWKAN